jgi:alpha-L-rhamnosidase
MIDNGATTIWERWDGWSAERGFQSPKMNSLNHYALGSVGEWVYRYLLGIDQQPGTAGFGELLMRPHPALDGRLDWARGSYRSVRGLIRAGWRVAGDEFSYQVELPANVAATVHVPAAGDGGAEAAYRVGPGTHSFTGLVPRF